MISQHEDAKIDLNTRVFGELVTIQHPSVIRNQNLFIKHAAADQLGEEGKQSKVEEEPLESQGHQED